MIYSLTPLSLQYLCWSCDGNLAPLTLWLFNSFFFFFNVLLSEHVLSRKRSITISLLRCIDTRCALLLLCTRGTRVHILISNLTGHCSRSATYARMTTCMHEHLRSHSCVRLAPIQSIHSLEERKYGSKVWPKSAIIYLFIKLKYGTGIASNTVTSW